MWKESICGKNCSTYLEAFFNSINEGIALHEIVCNESGEPIDYKFLEVNKVFAEIIGLNRESIVGKSAGEVLPDFDETWIGTFGKVALTGVPVRFESYNKDLDRHFRVSAFSPIKGQFTTLLTDITELKRAAAITKTHQILFENAQDVIFYAKTDGSIIDANTSAVLKYGYSIEELTQLNVQDLRHQSERKSFQKQMKEADKNGITFEIIHVKKDGTSFPAEVSVKSELINKERVRIHIARDISERKIAEKKIMYLANYDSLTGIPNRSNLMNHLKLTLENASRGGYEFALILFDIDKFKKINDCYGHNAGDEVLRKTTMIVQSAIRKVDFLARLGGDEFVIIQPFIKGKEDCTILVKRILKYLDTPLKLDNEEIKVALSMGISIYPENSTDIDALMKCSDDAMYATKQKGGGNFEFYSSNLIKD